jgi:hypothetical protein
VKQQPLRLIQCDLTAFRAVSQQNPRHTHDIGAMQEKLGAILHPSGRWCEIVVEKNDQIETGSEFVECPISLT